MFPTVTIHYRLLSIIIVNPTENFIKRGTPDRGSKWFAHQQSLTNYTFFSNSNPELKFPFFLGGGVSHQPTFDAESKNAKIQISIFGGGGGGQSPAC